MNSFNGTWLDQQNVVITINGTATAVTVVYSNGRGPFQGTINTSTSQITVNFTDDGGNKTGTLSNKNSEINWDNGTTWNYYYLRKNAWDANNGGQFTNTDGSYTDLYWYAKAVQQMQSLPISNPTSWWFFAAIHGEFLLPQNQNPPPNAYLNWPNITYIPSSANLGSLPSSNLTNLFWDQCQHGTWYFAPWHRGYLISLESILRNIIVSLGGPSGWSLPYWNYLNQSTKYNEYQIPPAFTANKLPDGTANPLYVPERYGPTGDGNVFIPVGQNMDGSDANDECQWDTLYSSSSDPAENPNTPPDQLGTNIYGDNWGGAETGFSHGNGGFGDLEMNPHNFIHVFVGGQNNSNGQQGLMAVPATAALDPIFYLHHANIDRMWAAWNAYGNQNPTVANWLNGPGTTAGNEFAMPLDANGTPWIYTPQDVQDTESVLFYGYPYYYTYDDLSLTSYDTTPPQTSLTQRLLKLGATQPLTSTKINTNMSSELIGSNNNPVIISGTEAQTAIKLDDQAWSTVTNSLLKASVSNPPDQVFLQLEGVKANTDSNFLTVFVNGTLVKTVALFGLSMASSNNGPHGGAGLTYKFNITDIVDGLHLQNETNLDSLDVQIKAKNPLVNGNEITIARVSVYRLGN